MDEAVRADPGHAAARALAADALEQLGYQAEAGTWRGAQAKRARNARLECAASASWSTGCCAH